MIQDSYCEESEQVFHHSLKFYMKILLGDLMQSGDKKYFHIDNWK